MAGSRSTVFKAGMEEGRQQIRGKIIDYLEEKLVNDKDNRPDRGSPEYEWAMLFTRELLKHVNTVPLD